MKKILRSLSSTVSFLTFGSDWIYRLVLCEPNFLVWNFLVEHLWRFLDSWSPMLQSSNHGNPGPVYDLRVTWTYLFNWGFFRLWLFSSLNVCYFHRASLLSPSGGSSSLIGAVSSHLISLLGCIISSNYSDQSANSSPPSLQLTTLTSLPISLL